VGWLIAQSIECGLIDGESGNPSSIAWAGDRS
jgi:hypothetical protein